MFNKQNLRRATSAYFLRRPSKRAVERAANISQHTNDFTMELTCSLPLKIGCTPLDKGANIQQNMQPASVSVARALLEKRAPARNDIFYWANALNINRT
jgi:hypothetical protein